MLFNEGLPVVRANGSSAVTPAGAILEGEVYFSPDSKVKDFGIAWSGSPNFSADALYRTKLSLGNDMSQESYAILVERDLLPGRTYHYRYYVETEDALIQSNTASFQSEGSTWNPWEQASFRLPYIPDLSNLQSVFLDGKAYLIGKDDNIIVFGSLSQNWEIIKITQLGLYPEPLFVFEGKAFFSESYGTVSGRIKVVNIRSGEIVENLPMPAPLNYYLETYFWFCDEQYCYTYLRSQPSLTLAFWKFDPVTMQGRALEGAPEFHLYNNKVQYWNDRLFVWSGQELWEYLPADDWEGSGEWALRAAYPGAPTTFGPTAVFISGNKLLAGWPKEAPLEERNELWEYDMNRQKWGLSHLAPGLEGTFPEYQVRTPEGYYFALRSPSGPQAAKTWQFAHDKFYQLEE